MSTLGVVPIRPSPQKLSAACVVVTTTPVQVTAAGALKPQPQPQRRPQLARDQRRRIGYQSYVPPPQPTNVLRRNARERNRVKQVNHGFAALRNHIPSAAKNKKLSKVDTLRRAVEYIQNLQALIDESDAAGSPHTSPPLQTLTPASTCSGDSGFAETRPLYLGSPAPAGHSPVPVGHSPVPVGHSPAPVGHSPALLPATAHLSPACSDASSPAPSFASDQPSYGPQSDYDATGYADYADHGSGYGETENLSPADEELLDAIAWWQSSQ